VIRALRSVEAMRAEEAEEPTETTMEEAFDRFDVDGPLLLAAHARPNENAWLIGQALFRAGLLPTQQVMGMVGARGLGPTHRRHLY
jgi:hypothetical protein